jgi:hypothetical protein
MQQMGGPQLREAIELVSPANKDRASHCNTTACRPPREAEQRRGTYDIDGRAHH